MNCPSCGASVIDGAAFCERCGARVGIPRYAPWRPQAQPKKDNTLIWIVIVVIVLVVVLPIVMSALMYYWVLGFAGTNTSNGNAVLMTSAIVEGEQFTFVSVAGNHPWEAISVQLSNGVQVVDWSPGSVVSSYGVPTIWIGPPRPLGALEVFFNTTDYVGNDLINQGDFFTLTTGNGVFSPAVSYSVEVINDLSGAQMCSATFTG